MHPIMSDVDTGVASVFDNLNVLAITHFYAAAAFT